MFYQFNYDFMIIKYSKDTTETVLQQTSSSTADIVILVLTNKKAPAKFVFIFIFCS